MKDCVLHSEFRFGTAFGTNWSDVPRDNNLIVADTETWVIEKDIGIVAEVVVKSPIITGIGCDAQGNVRSIVLSVTGEESTARGVVQHPWIKAVAGRHAEEVVQIGDALQPTEFPEEGDCRVCHLHQPCSASR